MKVERKEEKVFVPVTITLESQFEVDVLFSMAGKVAGRSLAKDFVDRLYISLEEMEPSEGCYKHFEGYLITNFRIF